MTISCPYLYRFQRLHLYLTLALKLRQESPCPPSFPDDRLPMLIRPRRKTNLERQRSHVLGFAVSEDVDGDLLALPSHGDQLLIANLREDSYLAVHPRPHIERPQ
jgi:hypothetical protein